MRFVTAADLTQRIEWLDDLTPQGEPGAHRRILAKHSGRDDING